MSILRFSILSYFPSFITDENINIGILFYEEDTNRASFHSTKNWDRVKAFDDELNLEFMKDYLKGLSMEVEGNLFNLNDKFDVEGFVKYYVNEYKFSKVQTVCTDDVEDFIEDTKKIYLKFDYEKPERLTKKQETQYIYKLLRTSDIEYSRLKIKGIFDENIKYDYIIGDYGVKLFTFEGKSLSHLIVTAKLWAFNAMEMRDKYKTIFIYDKEQKDVAYFESIINILSRYAHKVMVLQEGIDYLLTLNSIKPYKDESLDLLINYEN